jgi:hypothetical protein
MSSGMRSSWTCTIPKGPCLRLGSSKQDDQRVGRKFTHLAGCLLVVAALGGLDLLDGGIPVRLGTVGAKAGGGCARQERLLRQLL